MHIAEGVLSAPVLAAGWVGGLALVSVSLKKTPMEALPRVAMMSAVFFLGSLVSVPLPLGPTPVHLILAGLIAMFIGWSAILAIFLALFLQALLFQYGGLSSLGPNTFIIAGPSVILSLFLRRPALRPGWDGALAAFVLGSVGVAASAGLLCLALYLSDPSLGPAALIGLANNCLEALMEGAVTALAARWLRKNFAEF